jgi:hypothetical protein
MKEITSKPIGIFLVLKLGLLFFSKKLGGPRPPAHPPYTHALTVEIDGG